MRLSRDQMLMTMAHVAAARGTCNRLSVGAVISFESRPVSIGYNGAPSGAPHCNDDCNEHSPCLNTIHAEENAIRWARAFGINPRGSTIHVTDSPCSNCADWIVDAGIVRLVYDREYRNSSVEWLRSKGVEVERCQIEHAVNANLLNSLITHVSRG